MTLLSVWVPGARGEPRAVVRVPGFREAEHDNGMSRVTSPLIAHKSHPWPPLREPPWGVIGNVDDGASAYGPTKLGRQVGEAQWSRRPIAARFFPFVEK